LLRRIASRLSATLSHSVANISKARLSTGSVSVAARRLQSVANCLYRVSRCMVVVTSCRRNAAGKIVVPWPKRYPGTPCTPSRSPETIRDCANASSVDGKSQPLCGRPAIFCYLRIRLPSDKKSPAHVQDFISRPTGAARMRLRIMTRPAGFSATAAANVARASSSERQIASHKSAPSHPIPRR
jgi:hypothetical protein